MEFNLFDLHDSEEDTTLRHCLRAYNIIPKYCNNPAKKNFEALKINIELRQINKKLKKQIGINWTEKWAEIIPYKVSKKTINDWILGRASIPLIAISVLRQFECEKETKEIAKNLKYVSSTTGSTVKIPNKISPDIIYLSGLILGDGCLPIIKRRTKNFEYKVIYYSGKEIFVTEKIIPLMKKVFKIEKILFGFRHQAWELTIKNKAIFRFFTQIMGLPSGKKSIKAHIPETIKKLKPNEAVPFLAGLIDSDLGKHGNSIGCTFRSQRLVNDLVEMLAKLNIESKNSGTYLIKEKYPQTDFKIKKNQIKRLKYVLDNNYLPKNPDRIKAINLIAGVPKRSNGLGLGE